MNLNEQNSSASDEVAAAEAELRAAQETLKAARARLSELKGEHPAVEPGAASSDVVGDGEPVEAFGVAAVVVDEDTAEVEAVIFEAEAVSADDGSQGDLAADEADADDADEPGDAPACEAGEADEPVASDKTGSLPDDEPGSANDGAPAAGDAFEPAAASPADTAAIPVQGEPTPDWVPYTTAPATDPTFGSQPTPSTGASYDAPYAPPAVSAAPGPVPPAPGQGSYQQPQQPPQPQQPYGGYAAPYGQTPHAGPGAVPPQQPYYGYQQPYYQQPYQQPVIATKDHVAAGLLAIFLGALGIHKFYLGYNTAGFIMLAVTILGSLFTFGLAGGVMWVIGVIEGILYLTKSQSEFEQTYVVNKREWF